MTNSKPTTSLARMPIWDHRWTTSNPTVSWNKNIDHTCDSKSILVLSCELKVSFYYPAFLWERRVTTGPT